MNTIFNAIYFTILLSVILSFGFYINSNINNLDKRLTRIEKQIKEVNYNIEPKYITHSDTIKFKDNGFYSVSEPKK